MIIIQNLTLSFGQQLLFDDISVTFQFDQKIGIVGRNGAGKSTLLKVLAKQQSTDSGTISCQADKTIAYMPQDMVFNTKQPVYDAAFAIFDTFLALEKEQHVIEQRLSQGAKDPEKDVERLSEIIEKLSHFDRIDAERRTNEILSGLGFDEQKKKQPVDTLSVGWKMRVVLAQLLLKQADFYLFDEPTNHLDITTKEWFLRFLQQASFGFLLVSHDRHFLDNACTAIFELERGRGTMYYGNFSFYIDQKEERRASERAAYERQQREIAKKEETIERFRAKSSKAKAMKSMQKQLDKIERIEVEPTLPQVSFSFPQAIRSGKVVLTVKNISYSFATHQLFKDVSFEVMRGQKLALVAPNGVGKTTLLNLIAGKLSLQHGSVVFGHNVRPAFFEQDQTRVLKSQHTIFEEVSLNCSEISDTVIRSFLGSFLFPGDDIYKKISVLSGGERNRVAMVKVLLQKANLLLLDEPTNHLDLYAKDVLLQALRAYEGTILFVSHDHNFIQQLATGILELTSEKLYYYPGTYEQFLADKHSQLKTSNNLQKKDVKQDSKETQQRVDQSKKIKQLENVIQRLEHEQQKIIKQLEKLAYGTPEYNKTVAKLISVEKQIETATQEWEELF